MTVPTLETMAISAFARIEGHDPDEVSTPDQYEAVLAPIYALVYATVQGRPTAARPLASGASVRMWGAMHPESDDLVARVRAIALRRGLVPAVAGLLNAAGLGPFGTEMTGPALRRAGIAAMCRVVELLGIEADWVIYGHTHRAGPFPGEGDWRAPTGARLINTGAWTWSRPLAAGSAGKGPYWPGRRRLDVDGPPRLVLRAGRTCRSPRCPRCGAGCCARSARASPTRPRRRRRYPPRASPPRPPSLSAPWRRLRRRLRRAGPRGACPPTPRRTRLAMRRCRRRASTARHVASRGSCGPSGRGSR